MLQNLIQLLIGIFAIFLIISFHELGHFIAARLCAVNVETFSFGIGPSAYRWMGRKTITEFRFSVIPLGGYCRMSGAKDLKRSIKNRETYIQKITPGSIYSVHPLQRILIYLSGPLANAFIAFTFVFLFNVFPFHADVSPAIILRTNNVESDKENIFKDLDEIKSIDGIDVHSFEDAYVLLKSACDEGREVYVNLVRGNLELSLNIAPMKNDDGSYSFGIMKAEKPVISRINHSSREYIAGLRENDIIAEVNYSDVFSTRDFYNILRNDRIIKSITVDRYSHKYKIEFSEAGYYPFDESGEFVMSFAFKKDIKLHRGKPIFNSLVNAPLDAVEFCKRTFVGIINVFKGRQNMHTSFSGPMRAAKSIGEITDAGMSVGFVDSLRAVFFISAMISASMCVVNLFPFPSLDGAGIVIGLIELFRKEKILKTKEYVIYNYVSTITLVVFLLLIWLSDMGYAFT